MIKFPKGLIAVPDFPGYFWNYDEQALYSIKVTGELKPMKLQRPNYHNKWSAPGYQVSKKNVRRTLMVPYLKTLKPYNYTIQYTEQNKLW